MFIVQIKFLVTLTAHSSTLFLSLKNVSRLWPKSFFLVIISYFFPILFASFPSLHLFPFVLIHSLSVTVSSPLLSSPLLSSASGYISSPSPNNFTLRLSSCCNWTEFDLLLFPLCLLSLISPFSVTSVLLSFPIMQYTIFQTSVPRLCRSLLPFPLVQCFYALFCVLTLCSKREGGQDSEEERRRKKVRAACYEESSLAAQSYTLCPEATRVHCGKKVSGSLTPGSTSD